MNLFRRPSDVPLWRDEITIDAADERYVARRQFTKFLVLTSFGMFVGQLWIAARALFSRRASAPPPAAVARVGEIPVGGSRVFHYPAAHDPCLLIRTAEDTYVAYSQKCTHLSCAVYFAAEEKRIECPCHEGGFAVSDGRVLYGPPPRPLPRVRLERRGDQIVAVGMEPGGPADHA